MIEMWSVEVYGHKIVGINKFVLRKTLANTANLADVGLLTV